MLHGHQSDSKKITKIYSENNQFLCGYRQFQCRRVMNHKVQEPVFISRDQSTMCFLPGMFDFNCLNFDNLGSSQNKYLILIS